MPQQTLLQPDDWTQLLLRAGDIVYSVTTVQVLVFVLILLQ